MQIVAYKDPVTGVMFEHKKDLDNFQAGRKREEAAEKLRREALEAADHVRQTLVRELRSRLQFCELAHRMYEHALSSAKRKRGKAQLHVEAIRVDAWRITSNLRLVLAIEVELSGNPETCYDTFVRLSPPEVLYPFRLDGCGHATESVTGTHVYRYGIAAELQKLPKLLAKMREAAKLARDEDEHQKVVNLAVAAEQERDRALIELKEAASAAQLSAQQAQEQFTTARGAQHVREQALAAEVSAKMPFTQKAQLAGLVAETGLPNPKESNVWPAPDVRRALLREPVAEA